MFIIAEQMPNGILPKHDTYMSASNTPFRLQKCRVYCMWWCIYDVL